MTKGAGGTMLTRPWGRDDFLKPRPAIISQMKGRRHTFDRPASCGQAWGAEIKDGKKERTTETLTQWSSQGSPN